MYASFGLKGLCSDETMHLLIGRTWEMIGAPRINSSESSALLTCIKWPGSGLGTEVALTTLFRPSTVSAFLAACNARDAIHG